MKILSWSCASPTSNNIYSECLQKYFCYFLFCWETTQILFLPTMHVVQGKVMFSHVSVILFTGGGGLDHEPPELCCPRPTMSYLTCTPPPPDHEPHEPHDLHHLTSSQTMSHLTNDPSPPFPSLWQTWPHTTPPPPTKLELVYNDQ